MYIHIKYQGLRRKSPIPKAHMCVFCVCVYVYVCIFICVIYFYCHVYVFSLLCMFCSVYSVLIVPTGTLQLP